MAIHEEDRRLVATISETSEVMVTAALWEMLLTTIHRDYPDWRGRWRVSFFTDAAAAVEGAAATPDSHVADYDGETMTLTLWPQLETRRRELSVEVK